MASPLPTLTITFQSFREERGSSAEVLCGACVFVYVLVYDVFVYVLFVFLQVSASRHDVLRVHDVGVALHRRKTYSV